MSATSELTDEGRVGLVACPVAAWSVRLTAGMSVDESPSVTDAWTVVVTTAWLPSETDVG